MISNAVVGAVLAGSGLAKARNRYEFYRVVHSFGYFNRRSTSAVVAVAVIALELCIGMANILGRAMPWPAIAAATMLSIFSIAAIAAKLLGHAKEGCGCFGGRSNLDAGGPLFLRNSGLICWVLPALVPVWSSVLLTAGGVLLFTSYLALGRARQQLTRPLAALHRGQILICLAAAFFCRAAGQIAAPGSGADIHGLAIDPDGRPVPNVEIRLYDIDGNPSTTRTRDDGTFWFSGVQRGRYQVLPGTGTFMLDRRFYTELMPTIEVPSSNTVPEVALRLVPQAVVSGRITDRRGDPAAGVRVSLVRHEKRRGLLASSGGSATTDDRGMYRIAGLLPGRYFMAVHSVNEGFQPWVDRVSASEAVVLTFYAGVTQASAARPIDLRAGDDHRNINLQMATAPVWSIRGRVIDPDGHPVPNALLYPLPDGLQYDNLEMNLRYGRSESAPDGSFEFVNRVAGAYKLLAIHQAPPPSPSFGVNFVPREIMRPGEAVGMGVASASVYGADVDNVTVIVRPPQTIRGYVENLGLPPQDTPLTTIRLEPDQNFMLWRDIRAQVDANGRFELKGVYATRFKMSIQNVPPGKYVKSIQFGERNITGTLLDVSNGESGDVKVAFADGAASVGGMTSVGVQVSIWPRSSLDQRVWTTLSDARGAFAIKDLPPGEYYAAAWEFAEPDMLAEADFRSRFRDDAVKVSLNDGAEVRDVLLKPIALAKIEAAAYGR
jgi:protocatechuate 3,4-dioxygenase beta subunit